MVLVRLVVQDAMRGIYDVLPEVRSKMCVDDKKFDVQAEQAQDTTKASRTVYEELKKQMNMGSLKSDRKTRKAKKERVKCCARADG